MVRWCTIWPDLVLPGLGSSGPDCGSPLVRGDPWVAKIERKKKWKKKEMSQNFTKCKEMVV